VLVAEELGATLFVTLDLAMRVTALFCLLATTPFLAKLAAQDDESKSGLSEDALLAATPLDLRVWRSKGGGAAFDPREFRAALGSD
jgi:hypothetical protein